jgi:hypothetical protein
MRIHRIIPVALGMLCFALTASPVAQGALMFAQAGSLGGGHVSDPIGVAIDQSSGDVYVGSLLFAGVGRFEANGHELSTFDSGLLSGTAVNPTNGEVYVINAEAPSIEAYDPVTGSKLSEFSIAGSANFAELYTIVQIATDSTGDVYLPNAPNNEIQQYSPTGTVLQTITGAGTNTLSKPTGVTVDPSGDVYVADDGNGRIEEFNPFGALITTIPSTGVQAVALDKNGDIYAGEVNSEDSCGSLHSPCFHVAVFNPAGIKIGDFGAGTIGISGLETINTLAVNQTTGTVYVTDGANDVVWMYGPPVLLPDVSTGTPPVSVTSTTATVQGTVNPDDTTVSTCRFQFGGNVPYTESTACSQATPLTGDSAIPVSAELVNLQPDTTYHYQLQASNSNGTNSGEDHTFTTEPAKPTLDNQSASGISQTTAILNASINPNNQDTTYHFEYDTTAYNTPTPHGTSIPSTNVDIGSGYGDIVIGAQLTGLQPATTYHYRVIATNITGESIGTDHTFTTPPAPAPVLETGSASEISQNSASITGTIDTQGIPTTYEFDLGIDTSYGTRIFGGEALSGAAPETVRIVLRNLATGTTYHYRIVAHNAYGTTYGADQTFTTPSFPTALLSAPVTPTLIPTPPPAPSGQASVSTAQAKPLARVARYTTGTRTTHKHKKKSKRSGKTSRSSKTIHGTGRSK